MCEYEESCNITRKITSKSSKTFSNHLSKIYAPTFKYVERRKYKVKSKKRKNKNLKNSTLIVAAYKKIHVFQIKID